MTIVDFCKLPTEIRSTEDSKKLPKQNFILFFLNFIKKGCMHQSAKRVLEKKFDCRALNILGTEREKDGLSMAPTVK